MDEMIIEGPMFDNKGWICPICGAAVSPNEKVCPKCNGNKMVYTVTDNSYTTCTWNNESRQSGEQMIFS